MIKKILGPIALLVSAPAMAGVTSTSYLSPPVYDGTTTLLDFTGNLPSGFSLNGGTVLSDSNSTGAYQGALRPTGGSGSYLAVGTSSGTQAVLKGNGATGWGAVSLLWGSIDAFNRLDVLDTLGQVITTITGADFSPGERGGEADRNRYVTYAVDPNSGRLIGGLKFLSPTDAFEIDNVAFSKPVSVPEPATVALFLVGLMGLFAMRGRRFSRA